MTRAIFLDQKGVNRFFDRADKKAEHKKCSGKKKKGKLQKPPPERHRLFDDPEFIKMAALSKKLM